MTSKRQKSLIKHYLYENQPWRVLLEYVTVTAAQVYGRLTAQALGASSLPFQGQSGLSQRTSRLS